MANPPPGSTAAIREALERIVAAYDAYRGRGVLPAPTEYRHVVEAIEHGRASLSPEAAPDSNGEAAPVSVNRLNDGTIDVFWRRPERLLVNLDLRDNAATWAWLGKAGSVPVHPAVDYYEAAPVPAAMPQIEVGDVVLWGKTERQPVADYRSERIWREKAAEWAAEGLIAGIERDGAVIWRRAEAPRP